MERLTENKIVLVVRETRLEELKARFNTVSQARFYVEQLGGDFADYEQEDSAYRKAVEQAQQQLGILGRVQLVHRTFVPNFIFGPDDIAVAVGQDGLVANTLKYLSGQPLIGVNPDPSRYDGQLLPFVVGDLTKIVPEVFKRARPTKSVTMAKASLNNGQVIYAVNDLFIGPKSHGSARYTIHYEGQAERHSSSGVIVSTGLGSTGWFSSLIAGAQGVAATLNARFTIATADGQRILAVAGSQVNVPAGRKLRFPWDADHLFFTVREPFPSKTTGAEIVFGKVAEDRTLTLESHMPERGVIFSDGVEADFLEFNSGAKADIAVAERKGVLVV
jgi:NAD kinase